MKILKENLSSKSGVMIFILFPLILFIVVHNFHIPSHQTMCLYTIKQFLSDAAKRK